MKCLMTKSNLFVVALAVALVSITTQAEAASHAIIDSPQHIGQFTHNVFHTSRDGGPSGSILAWMDLDRTATNTYDPMNGDFMASFNLYTDSGFTSPIGNVIGLGSLPGANFQGDGGLAGTITWNFTFDVDNILEDYLEGVTAVTMNYFDQVYITSALGTDVNSWDDPYLSLWGAGRISLQDACDGDQCFPDSKYLGSDVVVETAHTPEPVTALLFASGMAGMATVRRKKKA